MYDVSDSIFYLLNENKPKSFVNKVPKEQGAAGTTGLQIGLTYVGGIKIDLRG